MFYIKVNSQVRFDVNIGAEQKYGKQANLENSHHNIAPRSKE